MLEDVMPLLKKEQDAKEMQVAEVGFAGNIKMITMKKLILLLLFIPLVSFGQVKNGEVKTYYESGKLFSVANWKNDKEDGLWKVYYENGQLKVEQNYKDGVLHKEIEFNWDENSSYEIKVTDYIDEFTISNIKQISEKAGFEIKDMWYDEKQYFAMILLSKND